MNRPIPSCDYENHFDPELEWHRAWLQAALERLVDPEPEALVEGGPCGGGGVPKRPRWPPRPRWRPPLAPAPAATPIPWWAFPASSNAIAPS